MMEGSQTLYRRFDGEERERLLAFIAKGKASARALLKARILLKADAGGQGESWAHSRIAEALETNTTMIERVRAKFVTEGFEAVWRAKCVKHHPSNLFSTARPRPS